MRTNRPLLHRIFKAGLGNTLFTVWRQHKATYGMGQTVFETQIMIGRYTLLRWTTYVTPEICSNDESR